MKKITLLSLLLAGGIAQAYPTVYPKKPELLKGLKLPEDVHVIADNSDDRVFYVLPPANAYAYSTDLNTASSNLGFCDTMAIAQDTIHGYALKMDDIRKQMDAAQPATDLALEEYQKALEAANAYRANSTVSSTIAQIDDKIVNNQMRLDSLYKQKESCTTQCKEIYSEIKTLQNDIWNLNVQRRNLVTQHDQEIKQYERLMAIAEVKNQQLLARQNYLSRFQDSLDEISQKVQSIYGRYAKLEGGTVTISYSSDWEKKISETQQLNPDKNFKKADVYGIKLSAGLIPAANANYSESIPAILDYTVAGRRGADVIDLGNYPSEFTVNARLSLAGACAIANPERFKVAGIKPGEVKFGLTTSYTYDSAFNTKINCEYSEKDIYEKVLKGGSSGFLFWKKSWQSMNITSIKNSGFSCTWNQEQQQQLDFYQRRKFEIFAFNYVMGRMLTSYAEPSKDHLDVNYVPVPGSGLNEVGQGLNDLCGAENIYCRAGAWVLKSLDAIFGAGQSSSNGRRTFESRVTLNWDDTSHQPMTGMTSFNPAKKESSK